MLLHLVCVCFPILVLQVASQYPAWICIGPELNACYLRSMPSSALSFDDAVAGCASYGSTLAIFPYQEEHYPVYQILTMLYKIDYTNAIAGSPYYFWANIKFDQSKYDAINDNDMYWLTTIPNKFIGPNDWKPPAADSTRYFRVAPADTSATSGCVRIKIEIIPTDILIWFQKTDCTQTVNIGYLCEKQEPKQPDLEWYSIWQNWDPDSYCQGTEKHISRYRYCLTYNCQSVGNVKIEEMRACCDAPPLSITNGNILREYRWANGRGIENNTALIRCHKGYVHPTTRYSTHRVTCVMKEDGSGGEWSPAIPTQCVITDCGPPPLGVHAYPPEYTTTTYGSVATYFCQPGFKEPKNGRTSVTLRCGNSDTWIGLDNDPNTRANCEPLREISTEWIHFPVTSPGGTDHCYKLHHEGKSWDDAKEQCEGGLLYLVSANELEFLKNKILEPQAERSVLWLAGQKLMTELLFTWRLENGSNPTISSFTKWANPGPIQATYHRDLCIAASYSNAEWLWVNVTCDNKFEYVCKTMQQKRDGAWTDWTEWSVCDRNYIRRRSHVCNNPSPFCGGVDCAGEANEKSYCCVDPGKGRFADIYYRSISNETVFLLPGHYYTYRCWFGYEHVEGGEFKNITCLNDGTWTDPGGAPNCVPKKCPLPVNGSNSYFTPTINAVYEHGTRVSYDCEQGFGTTKDATAAIGSQTECSDGSWVDPPLTCYAKVCANPHPQLSVAEYSARHINSSYIRKINTMSHESWGWESSDNSSDLYNDNYQYFCEHGYRTPYKRVEYNLTCLMNGDWSSETLFAADSHPTQCEPVECPGPPPQPRPNSVWVSGSNPNQANLRGKYTDLAIYSCIPGYQVETGVVNDTRVLVNYTFMCGANNDWTDDFSPEQCIKQSCGDPGYGSNVENRIGKDVLYKDQIDYVCLRGFVFNDTVTRRRLICDLYDGSVYTTWNGTELNCSKIDCGDPGIGDNVVREGSSFEYDDVLLYTCLPQHVLIGGGLEKLWIRCTSQGTWNGTAPNCEPAEISSDFDAQVIKPFTIKVQWIMSEKYRGVLCQFRVYVYGKPAYEDMNGDTRELQDAPPSTIDDRIERYSSSAGGLLSYYILTKPEYVYELKLESESGLSTQEWPEGVSPIRLFTSGGIPFLGSVQEQNLPEVIPLHALPKARKRPTVLSYPSTHAAKVTFDRRMFSEQNGTILGFTVIVKEVHPFHVLEPMLAREGYHDRFPNELYNYHELQSFSKYTTWPPYFATPICNLFGGNFTNCQNATGGKPSDIHRFEENFTVNEYTWRDSIYSNYPEDEDNQKVTVFIGTTDNCESYSSNQTCNGPLRKNRKFCVKLRAYNRYGWNDTMCSDVIQLEQLLEFDHALIIPTILAALPFAIFCTIGIYIRIKDGGEDYVYQEEEPEDFEGELIKTWSMHQSAYNHDGLMKAASRRKSVMKKNVSLMQAQSRPRVRSSFKGRMQAS